MLLLVFFLKVGKLGIEVKWEGGHGRRKKLGAIWSYSPLCIII